MVNVEELGEGSGRLREPELFGAQRMDEPRHLLVGPLTAQPQGQCRDLCGPQINVDSMQVVLKDQSGHGTTEIFNRRVVLP